MAGSSARADIAAEQDFCVDARSVPGYAAAGKAVRSGGAAGLFEPTAAPTPLPETTDAAAEECTGPRRRPGSVRKAMQSARRVGGHAALERLRESAQEDAPVFEANLQDLLDGV